MTGSRHLLDGTRARVPRRPGVADLSNLVDLGMYLRHIAVPQGRE
jgi:hypothetical protein